MEERNVFGEKGTALRNLQVVIGLVLFFLLVVLPGSAWSQALFTETGSFKVLKPCKAYVSMRKSTGPSELKVFRTYVAFGENKPKGSTHAYIEVDGQRKWVGLECGEYVGGRPPFRSRKGGRDSDNDQESGSVGECLPFFNDVDDYVNVKFGGKVDITPVAPEIESFGAAVNDMCGAPGKETSREEFMQLMKDHPDVLSDIMAYTGGKVYSYREAHEDVDAYLDDLTEAWFSIKAFDHIFCGEPNSTNKIGGLHYFGRYYALQENGDACRMPNYQSNEVVPGVIYTMGVHMKRADGGWAKFPVKGYGLTLSAVDILKAATRAFSENPTSSQSSKACILEIKDGDADFSAIFVRRAGGIRTFYPDATPDFNRNRACSKAMILSASENDCMSTP